MKKILKLIKAVFARVERSQFVERNYYRPDDVNFDEVFEQKEREIDAEIKRLSKLQNTMRTSRYYNDSHFPNGSMQAMSQALLNMLDDSTDYMRQHYRANYLHDISSAGRTHANEIAKGRNGNSAHVITDEGSDAVDIRNRGESRLRYWLLRSLFHAGCRRVGINFPLNFYHADVSTRPHHQAHQDVLFTY